MIIIAGYTRTDAEKRDGAVEAFRGMVERARAYDGCLDFSISADAVDPERVKAAVLEAIGEANSEFGTQYSAAAIGYHPDDSPRYELFGYCAYSLIKKLTGGVPFPTALTTEPAPPLSDD